MAVNEKYKEQINKVEFNSNFEKKTVALMKTQLERKGRIINMKKPVKIVAVAAAITSLLAISVFAISVLLTPGEVAKYFGNDELAQAFESGEAQVINQTVEDSGYIFTLEGIAPGKALEYIDSAAVDVNRTYVVVAMQKADGSEITYDDSVTFIPFFEGYDPWKVNGLHLGGASAHKTIQNNVLYYLWDFTDLEVFADRTIYLAGFGGIAPGPDKFVLNADGSIGFAEEYKGIKVMFEIQLDAAKANPEKANEMIENMGR
ncbi:MAG: DUF4179 domain-containing protein [Clostridia bacterium]|nr:DUF4179 domain-containing protein [Clostridia bacterium]